MTSTTSNHPPCLPILRFRLLLLAFIAFGAGSWACAQQLEWAFSPNSTAYCQGLANATDAQGNVITVGLQWQGSGDFDPGPGTLILNAQNWGGSFVQKLDSAGQLMWAYNYTFSNANLSLDLVETDAVGNVYLIGKLSGTADADPGPGTILFNGGSDAFVIKLNPQGNFVWVRHFDGAWDNTIKAAAFGPSNHLLLTGGFSGFTDFSPGQLPIDTLTGVDSTDAFVMKMDTAGNVVWVKRFGRNGGEFGWGIGEDNLGNVYSAGQFLDSIDMDPGIGDATLAPGSVSNIYVSKLDAAGNYVWARSVPVGYFDSQIGFEVAPNGDSHTMATFLGTMDCDPGPGVLNFTSTNSDMFLLKLNAAGNFAWAGQVGGTGDEHCYDLALGSDGSLYATGEYGGVLDVDPGPGLYPLTATSVSQYTLKMDAAGNFVWAFAVGSGRGTGIAVTPDDEIFTTGFLTDTTDFDPGPNVTTLTPGFQMDAFVAKYSQTSCSNFRLSLDSAANLSCTTQIGIATVSAFDGTAPYAYSWNTTPVQTTPTAQFTTPGIYTVSVTDSVNCQKTLSVLINGPSTQSGFDLQASLLHTMLRPGFPSTFWPIAHNAGCTSTNGQLSMVLDTTVVYLSATPSPTAVHGDTLVWNFTSLAYTNVDFVPTVQALVPALTPLNRPLCFSVIVDPQPGDFNPTDNVQSSICDITRGAFDPNDIQVYPSGQCADHYVLLNTPLQYKIRFQNTGNAEALEVSILDTLDPNLDLSTLVVQSTSHQMVMEVLPGNVVKFIFHDIHLPDSTTDEPRSHGYVVYGIATQPGLASGTSLPNRAAIYFDANPPVITNTATILLMDSIPPCTLVSVTQSPRHPQISLYPNPATKSVMLESSQMVNSVALVDALGRRRVVADRVRAERLEIDLAHFGTGVYFVEIRCEAGVAYRKLVVR